MTALRDAIADVCGGLRRRALWLKRLAAVCFLATLVLLGLAAWIVLTAASYSFDQAKEQSEALATQKAAADAQERQATELAAQFEAAKIALADKLIATWPPRRVGLSLYGSAITPDGRRGWAVGDRGTILRTENSGASWQSQTSGTVNELLSIHMSEDGLRGWAVDNFGTIRRTENGGASWQSQTSGTTNTLRSIQMTADGVRGWAVGDRSTILRTEDGGASWQTQTSGTTNTLWSIQMSGDGLRGWAVGGNGTILLLTVPDVTSLRARTASADAVEAAMTALAPPQGLPKLEIDQLKTLELKRKDAEQQRDKLHSAANFLARQSREPGVHQGGGGGASDLFSPIYVRAYVDRAIVMLIVFFSVSMLLSVFRYALRLTSQYDGRADALRLTVGDLDQQFHQMVQTMVPNGVDFGKMPKSPGEMAFEMAKDMVGNMKRS